MKNKQRHPWLLLFVLLMLMLFCITLFFADNAYQTPPPYGRDGMITLSESDFARRQPLFLIDGWLLTDRHVTNLPTYIGEFSTLQRNAPSASPHGQASYHMTLRYRGADLAVALHFPQLFSDYVITWDAQPLAAGRGEAGCALTLTAGDHLLSVTTVSTQGYYSGMYHPPMLGRAETVLHAQLISCIAYGIALFVPLTLALFTLVLWHSAKDQTALWFCLLCCSFALYVSYYFIRLLHLPWAEWWYLVQSAALYSLCFCTVRLAALTSGVTVAKSARAIQHLLVATAIVLLMLALGIPSQPWVVRLHGILTDSYYLLTFSAVLLLILRSPPRAGWEGLLTRLACMVFGVGLLLNLFFSNLFEPILFFWQFEWCGLFLVALFGATMVARNKRILLENQAFSQHLEELVDERTRALQNLLQERKVFFADLAHDLKAPISATAAFIQAIRAHDTEVDRELLRYLDQVEQKQQEMARRVQGLSTFNKMDDWSEPREMVSVCAWLEATYQAHHMAAEVQSIHLIVEPPATDGMLFAAPRKLEILLENLIFNALHATPPDGKITIAAKLDEEGCHLSVADTGSGIPIAALPHIFQRFYVGEEKKASGSGLGLYIVKRIVDEQGGEITVSSKPAQGTVFYVDLPLKED